MKLSDIKGERAMDVAADLILPISNIASDEDAADLFRRRPIPEGMTAREFALDRIKTGIPILLKKHRRDLVTILSLLKDEPEESVLENMTLLSLTSDVTDLMTDDLFRVFFAYARTRPTSPESVQENTEAQEA